MIVQIRASNGAGKSTVMWNLMKRATVIKLTDEDEEVWAYELLGISKRSLYIFGRYEKPPAGGCDLLPTSEVLEGVECLAKLGDVIFEGAKVSVQTKRWLRLAKRLNTGMLFAHLETPIQDCIRGILHRREKAKIKKELIPEKQVIPKYKTIKTLKPEMIKSGIDVRDITRDNAADSIIYWLQHPNIRRFPRSV